MQHEAHAHEKCVFRSIAFPVSVFDRLKQFQRDYEATHGVRINNAQALAIIIDEHEQLTEESEEHGRTEG